ncbi:MAG: cation-transporting P-type ATPase, partial [Acidimicrobiia bacterium]
MLTADEVGTQLQSPPEGLDAAAVDESRDINGPNRIEEQKGRSKAAIFGAQF